jgi:hypothetical protein
MRPARFLAIPVIMFLLLACSLASGFQQIQQVVTEIPGVLTSAPTALGAIETAAAGQTSSSCGTTTPGGLGVSLDIIKNVLQFTQQVSFTDGTYNGQPESTATLASVGASTFPTIASGFSAQFIGDPCNLSEILVTIPRTDQQATIDEGIGIMNVIFAAFLPPDVSLQFLSWISQNYSKVPAGGQEQTTIGKMQFTLKRSQDNIMTLDLIPAP